MEAGQASGFTKSIEMLQKIYKEDGELAATHKCLIAWMDLSARKIVELPKQIKKDFIIENAYIKK